MSNYGYIFYFDLGSELLTFPITPGELTITSGSKNSVVTLINEGDINVLKSPSLTEVEFTARFPMRKYPYSREPLNFEDYLRIFEDLKGNKKSFRFIVARSTPGGKKTWGTNLLVALEDVSINESADEGDDVLVSFKLKQFKEYGVKTIKIIDTVPTTTSTSEQPRADDNKASEQKTYVVKKGDCLWNIAKAYYGNGAKYTVIYEANKNIIESTAKKYGKKSSSNGHWIYPGTTLIIPSVNGATTSSPKNTATDTTYTLTVESTGISEYVGKFAVRVDDKIVRELRQASTTVPFTVKVKKGSKVSIGCAGVNGHSYTISENDFKMTANKTVTIKWVR